MGVEVLVQPEVFHLFRPLESVEVCVADGGLSLVEPKEIERGGSHFAFVPEGTEKSARQRGLARPEFPLEEEHEAGSGFASQFGAELQHRLFARYQAAYIR